MCAGDTEGVLRGYGAVPGHEGGNSGEALSSGNKRNFQHLLYIALEQKVPQQVRLDMTSVVVADQSSDRRTYGQCETAVKKSNQGTVHAWKEKIIGINQVQEKKGET